MTKEEFLNGERFTFKEDRDKGDSTFHFTKYSNSADLFDERGDLNGYICEEIRSRTDDRIITDKFHCNIEHLGSFTLEGYVFLLGQKRNTNLKFDQMYKKEATMQESLV